MGFFSRVKQAVSRWFGGGGSSSRSSSRSSGRRVRYTPRSRSYSSYRSSGGGFRFNGQRSLRENLEYDRKRKEEQQRLNAYKAKDTKISSVMDRDNNKTVIDPKQQKLAETRKARIENRKAFDEATKKATPPKSYSEYVKEKGQKSLVSRKPTLEDIKAYKAGSRNVKKNPPKKIKGGKTVIDIKQQKIADARKKIDKIGKVKTREELLKSGTWEAETKKRLAHDVKGGERPTIRLTPEAYKKMLVDEKGKKTKYNKATSFAREAVGGYTFGTVDRLLAGDKKDPYDKEIEKIYQENKAKGYAIAGGLTGSIAGFGGAGKGATRSSERLLAKGAGRKAVGRLAESKPLIKLSERAAEKAVKKGTAKVVTGELVKDIANSKARRIVGGLLANAEIDLTAGLVNDINYASKLHEVGSKEWWDELKSGAKWNIGASALGVGIDALGKGSAIKEATRTLDKKNAVRTVLSDDVTKSLKSTGTDYADNALRSLRGSDDDVARIVGRETDDVLPTLKTKTQKLNKIAGINVRSAKKVGETERRALVKERQELVNSLRKTARNGDEMSEEIVKRAERRINRINKILDTPIEVEDTVSATKNTEKQVDNALVKEREELLAKINRIHNGEEKATKDEMISLGKKLDDIEVNLGMRNSDGTIKKVGKQAEETIASADDSLTSMRNRAKNSSQTTFDDIIKEEPPKTRVEKQPKVTRPRTQAEKQKEADMLRGLVDKRKQSFHEQVRSASGGEYGVRQGEATAAKVASSADEVKRINDTQQRIVKDMENNGFDKLGMDDDAFWTTYKRSTKESRAEAAKKATARVEENPAQVMENLRDLERRIEKSIKAGDTAFESVEHVTYDDLADVTAMRNLLDSSGLDDAAKAEYEKTFTHLIEYALTEDAQGLKAKSLFLRENSAAYREGLIRRDTRRFMEKVLYADEDRIRDIKRSFDARNGDGAFDKAIKDLSTFKGDETTYTKMYKDFQAELFMNSKPSVWDTVNLFRHSFMLSSIKTGGNNIIGNVMQRGMYQISDELAMGLEGIGRKFNPDMKRTTAHLKTSDQKRLANMFTNGEIGKRNLKNGKYVTGFEDQLFADKINVAAYDDIEEMMASSKYMGDIVKGLHYTPETAGGHLKQGLIKAGSLGNKAVSLMLNEPDSWFVERNYRTTLLKYLEANGVRNSKELADNPQVFRDARAFAKDVALENTYKKANNVVSFLEQLRTKGYQKGANPLNKAITITLDAEMPYLKVPANLVINNFKYSPLGMFKSVWDASKAVAKGDAYALNKATRELSKGLTGTGMAFLGYMMFCHDQLDDNSVGFIANADDALKEYGVRDNSFKFRDKNFSIANMGIGGVQFLIGASLGEDNENDIPGYQAIWDGLNKTVDVVADMSLLENAMGIFDLMGNGGDYEAGLSDRLGRAATQVAGDYAGQFIPNPLRGVAKGMTDADLDTGVKKGDTTKVGRMVERNINNFVQGVPVLNEKVLAHKVDTHGNLVNERKTVGDKAKQVAINVLDPLSTRTVKIPEADKEELKVMRTDENGNEIGRYKPKGFDPDREYVANVGQQKKSSVTIDLNRKEREQVARSAKFSGYDGARNVVQKGMFGDRLGARAQSILKNIPDDEEKAREFLFNTPEWKSADNATREKWLNAWYGEGQGNKSKGVARTRNAEAFINIAGNSEGDFRWQNDLTKTYQDRYNDYALEGAGIDKGTWADAIEAAKDTNHKFKDGKNVDTINSTTKVKDALLDMEGLSTDQRIAMFEAIRGNRNWRDWDGVTRGKNSYYRRRRGYRRRGYRRRGGGRRGSASTKSNIDLKAYKASTTKMKSAISTTSKPKTQSVKKATVKIEPPKTKLKNYKI